MLEESNFHSYIKPIAEHYRHELSLPIAKIYYQHLSENLNDAEFMEALKKMAIQFPVRMGLPSPQEIVEIILGSKQAMALQEWQMIVEAARQNSNYEALTYLSSRAHIALAAIGGLRVVAYHEGPLNWLQKSFTQVYCECSADDKILKQAPVTNPRSKPPADDELISPEQWADAKARMQKLGIWKSKR